MEELHYRVIRAEVESQLKEIERLFREVESRKKRAKRSKAFLESLGYQLHNLYSAFEDLFKIIAGYFENRVTDSTKYHKELLKKMTIAVPGVRPALLSEELYRHLDELRAFRHYFRHAYLHELRYDKIKGVIEASEKVRSLYRRDINSFLRKLKESIR